MTQEEIKYKYQQQKEGSLEERELLSTRIRKYGMLRLLFFLFWIICIFISTSYSWALLGPVLGGGLLIFSFLIRTHSRLHMRKDVLDQLVKINTQEENAMQWEFSAKEDGIEYVEEDHLFAYDLDLFGKGGLFQYINRSSTIIGKDRLAADLSAMGKSEKEINSRQKAIAELTQLFEWRQEFRVKGLMVEENKDDIPGLKNWIAAPPDFKSVIFPVLLVLVPLINFSLLFLVVINVISFWQFLAYLVIPMMIAGMKFRTINKKHNLISRKYPVLKKYSGLFRMIEEQAFTSGKMTENTSILMSNGISASSSVRQLARISNAFDTRLNLLAGFMMNIFFLWDIRQAVRLEKWKNKFKKHLPAWFDVLGEVDALVSFAGYAYNNPDFTFPAISENDELQLRAEELGHPLIPYQKRVCNDFEVDGWAKFTILTGANMAGKSTFLRTVGVNMLLAGCGAPVCARQMMITPIDIVSSIHTIDSLANNESYFYAELKRLKMIIDMLKEGKKIFIILDEILKGTNSRDKQSGSKALIEQLISLKAAGIIATHDLSLGELESRFPDHVQNQCFEIIIEEDRLDYDYRIKRGIAKNMNATILMERMGITVSQ